MCKRPASIVPGTQLTPSLPWECYLWLEGGCCLGLGNLSEKSWWQGAVLAFELGAAGWSGQLIKGPSPQSLGEG